MIYEQQPDVGYRRLYYSLQKLVDQAIGRILEALDASGMADDTIVVFTSDHGDMLGAHGGMQQKWCNAYDESIRVPMIVKGPGVSARNGGIATPTSHVDLIPTLMGLAGIDVERAAARGRGASRRSTAAPGPRPQRSDHRVRDPRIGCVAAVLHDRRRHLPRALDPEHPHRRGRSPRSTPRATSNRRSRRSRPATDGADELWKLNHYYERLDDWNEAHGIPKNPFAGPAAEPAFELHNLTADPEERHNRADDAHEALHQMQAVLDAQRDAKRKLPRLRNPVG